MFIRYEKRKTTKGELRTYVSIVDGFRDIDGKVRQRRVKSYGYLEEHDNPRELIKLVEKELIEFELEQDNKFQIILSIEENKNNSPINKIYNYGYKYLEAIYDELNIDSFLEDFQLSLNLKCQYKFNDIFKFLVLERILNPGSKRDNIKDLKRFYNLDLDFSLDDVYRFLTHFSQAIDKFQVHLRKYTDKLFKTSTERIYYDVTNYYFEIDYNDPVDNFRHNGVSKEHQLSPIIGFSLFLDSHGLPIKFNIFNGNTAESTTLIKELRKVKTDYNVKRTLVVADKALNTVKNITEIIENGDGFLLSQILRSRKGKRYHEEMFNEEGYFKEYNELGEVVYKYKTFIEEYEIVINGKKQILKRKVLIYYNLKDDIKMKNRRFEKILKAQKSLTNNAYTIDHSYMKYVKKEIINKKTGEINKDFKEFRDLDLEKIANDELFDGYFCIITSELDYTVKQIRETYHQLSEIEDVFKITKSNLEFRPVYHFKRENITSHFIICYTALLILRLFQYKLKNDSINLSAERIIRVLNSMNMELIKDIVHLHHVGGKLDFNTFIKDDKTTFNNYFDGTDQLEKDYNLIKLSFDTPFDYAYTRVKKFNSYFKNIKFRTTSA